MYSTATVSAAIRNTPDRKPRQSPSRYHPTWPGVLPGEGYGEGPNCPKCYGGYTGVIMCFPSPFHLFDSCGRWIGFCDGANLFNTNAVWCGWFPWAGTLDAVKPDGCYLGTVVGARFCCFERNQLLRVGKLIENPATPALPPRPAPMPRTELFAGATDINLKGIAGVVGVSQ